MRQENSRHSGWIHLNWKHRSKRKKIAIGWQKRREESLKETEGSFIPVFTPWQSDVCRSSGPQIHRISGFLGCLIFLTYLCRRLLFVTPVGIMILRVCWDQGSGVGRPVTAFHSYLRLKSLCSSIIVKETISHVIYCSAVSTRLCSSWHFRDLHEIMTWFRVYM